MNFNDMSISELVEHVTMYANEIDCSIQDNAKLAHDYCNDLSTVLSLLQERIEEYLEDEESA
jgi:hypothetical protein